LRVLSSFTISSIAPTLFGRKMENCLTSGPPILEVVSGESRAIRNANTRVSNMPLRGRRRQINSWRCMTAAVSSANPALFQAPSSWPKTSSARTAKRAQPNFASRRKRAGTRLARCLLSRRRRSCRPGWFALSLFGGLWQAFVHRAA